MKVYICVTKRASIPLAPCICMDYRLPKSRIWLPYAVKCLSKSHADCYKIPLSLEHWSTFFWNQRLVFWKGIKSIQTSSECLEVRSHLAEQRPHWRICSGRLPSWGHLDEYFHFMRNLVESILYLSFCGSFKSSKNNWVRKLQIRKSQKYPHIANPQIATFADGPQI